MAVVDYYKLANRTKSFTHTAPHIARLDALYRDHIVARLLEHSVLHWDQSIRLLAAESLGQMSCSDVAFAKQAVESVMPRLIERALTTRDTNERHGVLLALAQMVRGLQTCAQEVDPSCAPSNELQRVRTRPWHRDVGTRASR